MFHIMFKRQKWKRNSATHLNHATRTIYTLGSQFKLPRSESSQEQMRLLGHTNIKQQREIQWEVLEFSEEQKWLCDNLTFKAKQEKHCVQRDSQKAFQSTHRHYLPWIYCNDSNTHCTMVLWQKCGIFTLNFITGVKLYNYSKYVWLSYRMCAFILHVFRQFFIQIG